MKLEGKIEPIVLLLFFGMVFFTGAAFAAEHWYQSDGAFFQVMSNLLSGVTGAFLMRVKPQAGKGDQPIEDPAASSTTTILQAKKD